MVYTNWPLAVYLTREWSCQVRPRRTTPSAGGARQLGDDPVPVAPVDGLHELDRPSLGVTARALEEERRRGGRDAQRLRLVLVRHGRLDRPRALGDVDAVAVAEQLVERAPVEVLRLEAGDEPLWQVQRLDRHRFAVGKA